MIAWICIAEACMSWNALMEVINPVSFICYFQTYRFLGFSLFKTNMNEIDFKSLTNIQCETNMYFYSLFQLISLTLNLCLCVDLILTIYDPFSPAYRRTVKYYIFSVFSSFVLIMIIFGIGRDQNERSKVDYPCIAKT